MSTIPQHVREHLRSQLPQARPHCHRVPRMWAAPARVVKVLIVVGTVMALLEVIGAVTVVQWIKGFW